MKLRLCIAEQRSAPDFQVAGSPGELDLQPCKSTTLLNRAIPCTLDSSVKVRELWPEALETETSSTDRGVAWRQDQRAVVGARCSRSHQNVGGKEELPANIAEEFIYTNQRGILPFVTPGEPPILTLNLRQPSRIYSRPKPPHDTPIQVEIVLISSLVDIVEVAGE